MLPPLLNFRYGENRGINFGLWRTASASGSLIVVALVICAAVLSGRAEPVWATGQHQRGLLVGGALANVADRLIYGYVLDFLNMSCCGLNNPFVFNIADIFIFAGAIGLIFFVDDKKSGAKKVAKKRQ